VRCPTKQFLEEKSFRQIVVEFLDARLSSGKGTAMALRCRQLDLQAATARDEMHYEVPGASISGGKPGRDATDVSSIGTQGYGMNGLAARMAAWRMYGEMKKPSTLRVRASVDATEIHPVVWP
jgi:hypothetical protein